MRGEATLSMLILVARSTIVADATREHASNLVYGIAPDVWRLNELPLTPEIYQAAMRELFGGTLH